MNKPPAFRFYPKDFLADINVAIMTMEDRGVYITLLCHVWEEKRLPNDSRVLQRLCNHPYNQGKKWEDIWSVVGRCFYVKRGHLYHKRLDHEREKQNEWREKSSLGGQISAQKRWGSTPDKNKGGITTVKRVAQPKGKPSLSFALSSPKEKDIVELRSTIIAYLNEKAEKRFSPKTESTIRLINGRLKDNYTFDDFKYVIDIKTTQWKGDPKWGKFLRPQTLFAPTNFEAYLNEDKEKTDKEKFEENMKKGGFT